MDDGLADSALGEYEIGGDAMQAIPPLRIDSLQFQLWADGVLKFTGQIMDSRASGSPEATRPITWKLCCPET